jgi:hypothetical protein
VAVTGKQNVGNCNKLISSHVHAAVAFASPLRVPGKLSPWTKWSKHEAALSFPPGVEVKNAWGFTVIRVQLTDRGTTLQVEWPKKKVTSLF